MEKVKVS